MEKEKEWEKMRTKDISYHYMSHACTALRMELQKLGDEEQRKQQ